MRILQDFNFAWEQHERELTAAEQAQLVSEVLTGRLVQPPASMVPWTIVHAQAEARVGCDFRYVQNALRALRWLDEHP